jgi:Fe-S cluster assembly protein SufD
MSNSHLSAFTVATGGKRSRLDLCARHEGTLATTVLNGLYIARGEQHMDHHIEVDHQQPHGRSGQTFRGILADASTGVFNGRVHVAVDAQQVDAQQSNRNLLLSRDAVVSAKPELEVYADDVKCAHGTTIGELDPRQIFYLRSRGLPEVEAKDLLTFAFASDLVQRIEIPAVAARLTDFMSSRFSRAQDVEELL